MEKLVAAGLLLTSELSLEGVLQRVAELACSVIGSRYAAIGVLSEDHRRLAAFVTAGIDQETRHRIGPPPEGRGVLGLVMRERRIIRLADLQQHTASVGFPPGHPPMHSFLGVPIERRRGIFGILYLTEKLDGP
jgi:GAF domain-containing protein